MSIIKALFLGLKNQKVIPFNQMTPELHEQISRGLAKIMMAAKMTKAQLTKSQRDYITNQAKQVQEFEDRYITKIKDSAGNLIKKRSCLCLKIRDHKICISFELVRFLFYFFLFFFKSLVHRLYDLIFLAGLI